MASTLFSLYEIGRRLGIPRSSVVYYKDRFASYIPHTGEGTRRRYPEEALAIFREIREMFDKNHSAEEIEMELSTRYHKGFAPDSGEAGQTGPSSDSLPSPALAALLERMSPLLDDRLRLEQDLQLIKSEVTNLRKFAQEQADEYKARLSELESMVQTLSTELMETREQLSMQPGNPSFIGKPPDSFLELPLVIRTDSNEFLGVAGKTKHFSLSEFIAVIREDNTGSKNATLRWNRRDAVWVLNITTQDMETGSRRILQMEASRTVTPSGNEVVCLTKLVKDGKRTPDSFLLVLFRKIKDGFDL